MIRGLGAALAAVLLLTSCGASLSRRQGGATAGGPATAIVGKGLVLPSAEPRTDAGAKPIGTPRRVLFVLRLNDQNGRHPRGIPVQFTSPSQRLVLTDSDGEVKVYVPGVYKLHIVQGCGSTLEVTAGGYATVGVSPDQTKRGQLPVEWRHRFGPSAPIITSPAGDWKVGQTVTIRYTIEDHCKQDAAAPNASFPTYVFDHSANIAIIGTPSLRSDAKGNATVSVRCTAAGDPKLVLMDAQNPTDSLDLVGGSIGYAGRPRCVNA